MPDPIDPVAPAPASTEPPAAPVTFSQEQLDAVVRDRLARERAKFEGFDDLKAKAARFDEIEAANLTEVERLTKERDELRTQADTARAAAQAATLRSAVVAAAQRAGAVDPDAVVALLPNGKVTVGDDGQVTGSDEAVLELLAAKPYLVGRPAGPVPGGADGGTRTPSMSAGTFTASQIADRGFWESNKTEILAAMAAGRITPD